MRRRHDRRKTHSVAGEDFEEFIAEGRNVLLDFVDVIFVDSLCVAESLSL